MKNNITPLFFLFLTSLFICSLSLAQDKDRIDSLTNVLPNTEGKEKVKVLRDLCYYGSFVDPKEAIQWGAEAADLAISIGDRGGLCGAYNDLFTAYYNAGKLQTSLDYAEKALTVAKEIDNQSSIASSLGNISIIYKKNGEYSTALKYLFEALKIKESLEGVNAGNTLGEIAENYRANKDYSKALEYNILATEAHQKAGNHEGIGTILNNTAVTYENLNQYARALEYQEKAIENYKLRGDESSLAVGYNNLGKLYLIMGEYDEALSYFNLSLEIKERTGNKPGIPHTLQNMANVYAKLSDFKKAEYYAKKGLQLTREIKDRNKEIGILLTLSNIYEQFGFHKHGLEYANSYIELQDSIYNESKATIIADLDTRYQTSKKEAENKVLQAQSEKQVAEIKQKKQWVLLIGIGSAVLVLFFIALYRSYNQKNKINEQLITQKIELEQLNKTKDRFFGIIAHDLRNPVVSFQGISKLIQSYVKKGKIDRIEGLSHKISHSVENLNRLLDNLLSWASSQTGTLPYHPEPLDVTQVLEETFSLFAEAASSKQINLVNKIEGEPVVYADKNGVSTIFRNLISNALKFTPEGGEISVSASVEEQQINLTVADNGIGMDQTRIRSLFELSQNESVDGTHGEKGSGLGLLLCKEFAELNKGKIWVQSKLNVGTQFHLTLPVTAAG